MRVGVYVDAYNLYYGARGICGRGTAGWRWLDVRRLAESLVTQRRSWTGAHVVRVVYCTARIDSVLNPGAYRDQDVYLKALLSHKAVDHIEYGRYVARVKRAFLATADNKQRPVITTSQWPIMIKDASNGDVPKAQFMAQVLNIEEKGSDVNVATHLLSDVLTHRVDAALVISNDSDLSLPLSCVRQVVPLATINPGHRQVAGALKAPNTDGVGNHWWYTLQPSDARQAQMPSQVGQYVRPNGW